MLMGSGAKYPIFWKILNPRLHFVSAVHLNFFGEDCPQRQNREFFRTERALLHGKAVKKFVVFHKNICGLQPAATEKSVIFAKIET